MVRRRRPRPERTRAPSRETDQQRRARVSYRGASRTATRRVPAAPARSHPRPAARPAAREAPRCRRRAAAHARPAATARARRRRRRPGPGAPRGRRCCRHSAPLARPRATGPPRAAGRALAAPPPRPPLLGSGAPGRPAPRPPPAVAARSTAAAAGATATAAAATPPPPQPQQPPEGAARAGGQLGREPAGSRALPRGSGGAGSRLTRGRVQGLLERRRRLGAAWSALVSERSRCPRGQARAGARPPAPARRSKVGAPRRGARAVGRCWRSWWRARTRRAGLGGQGFALLPARLGGGDLGK